MEIDGFCFKRKRRTPAKDAAVQQQPQQSAAHKGSSSSFSLPLDELCHVVGSFLQTEILRLVPDCPPASAQRAAAMVQAQMAEQLLKQQGQTKLALLPHQFQHLKAVLTGRRDW